MHMHTADQQPPGRGLHLLSKVHITCFGGLFLGHPTGKGVSGDSNGGKVIAIADLSNDTSQTLDLCLCLGHITTDGGANLNL